MSKIVEVVAKNLFHGANLKLLKAGSVVELDDETADKWIESGKARKSDRRTADQVFEVSTPQAGPKPDDSALSEQLASETARADKAEGDLAAANELLKSETARADAAEKQLIEAKKK